MPTTAPIAERARTGAARRAAAPSSAPTDDELHPLRQTVVTRLKKTLTRRGVLVQDMSQTYLAEPARLVKRILEFDMHLRANWGSNEHGIIAMVPGRIWHS